MNNDYKINVEFTADDLKNIDVEQVKNEIARQILLEQQNFSSNDEVMSGPHSKSTSHSKSETHSRSALK
ncbi:hypothetical protein COL52_30850 [Bacillus toyonensis]|uniref:Uncharacterized protein n=1 Tax=Bacillus toyonensis TaxID=155322 RepID=A0A2B7WDX4_9BACI|nr:hypothetical protein [Bacillus toyonensis]PEJ90303.1 hypothetical protein CN688_26145 [Bacillus toyonensis]PEL24863.1 hypothetical protein CN624_16570 [Bacillus toyonensis]PFY53778.1 hypothetical protein COL52_30850 [Bacillus toyonensis]PGA74159.1 hypothetical protein COL90_27335 [Bacillus toyonensis]PGG94796.1 hypothetical protein CON73_00535 [Bacillus toyonensis]